MSVLALLSTLPEDVLLVMVGCSFFLLLLLLLLVAFSPTAAERIVHAIDILRGSDYPEKRIKLTIILQDTPEDQKGGK